jgi:hypothetical protein
MKEPMIPMQNGDGSSPPDLYADVLASLEPDQLVAAKARSFPRRNLAASEVLLLFSLRIYLLIMIGIVIYQILVNIR